MIASVKYAQRAFWNERGDEGDGGRGGRGGRKACRLLVFVQEIVTLDQFPVFDQNITGCNL